MKADCEIVIKESRNKPVQHGSLMFMLCQKITQCRRALVDWSRAAFGNVSNQTSALMEMVEALQTDNDRGQHNQRLRELRRKLIHYYSRMSFIGDSDPGRFG
jgi:hypothetical protein